MLAAGTLLAREPSPWPSVQPVDQTFVVTDPKHPVIRMVLKETSDAPIYLFICRNGNDQSVPGAFFSGTLDCRLMEAGAGEELEENLLVEFHDLNIGAWHSRGRMWDSQLYGDCATYPDYGRVRHFRLRGFCLTMKFTAVHFGSTRCGDSPCLASYKLEVSVRPDATALRDIAESSGYHDPSDQLPGEAPGSCSIVRKGVEWPED